jgi:hypothetical protein
VRYVIEKDGERQNVTSLGGYDDWTVVSEVVDELPDHEAELVDGAWVIPLDILKARKWEDIKFYRDLHRHMGCDTPKGRMDNDPESQAKVNGAVTMAQLLGDVFSIDWTMEDNSVVTHNKAEMEAAGVAMGEFDATCHAIAQALRAATNAAASEAELDAIDITAAPWP